MARPVLVLKRAVAGDGGRVGGVGAQADLALQSLRRPDLAEQHAVTRSRKAGLSSAAGCSAAGSAISGAGCSAAGCSAAARVGRRRRGGSLGGGLGLLLGGGLLGLFALEPLLAGLALLRVRARVALPDAGRIEEAEHAVGRLRAHAEPMLDPLLDEFDALGRAFGQERIVGADLLDVAAVARAPRIGDDDAVIGPLLGAGPRQSDLQ